MGCCFVVCDMIDECLVGGYDKVVDVMIELC